MGGEGEEAEEAEEAGVRVKALNLRDEDRGRFMMCEVDTFAFMPH